MPKINVRNLGLSLGTGLAVVGLGLGSASALSAKAAASTSSNTTTNQAKLQLIINRGNSEISRRLTTLGTLSSKINGAQKLSSGDKASLTSEVSSETANLTSLKTKIDADTDVTTAKTDAQSIISDYRVYALIVPKVNLLRTADDQQVAEGKLSTLASKLQSRLTSSAASSLQSALSDMTAKTRAAQAISSNIESSVINLQPSDYDSNHSVLSGDRDQLKTAQTDIQAAVSDGKTIVAGLKS